MLPISAWPYLLLYCNTVIGIKRNPVVERKLIKNRLFSIKQLFDYATFVIYLLVFILNPMNHSLKQNSWFQNKI